jgi:hypothetical protein
MSPYSTFSPQALKRVAKRSPATRNLWQALPEANRHRIRRGYEHFAYRVDLWNQREKATADTPAPAPATLVRLRQHFAHDSEVIHALLGETPPWQTLPNAA